MDTNLISGMLKAILENQQRLNEISSGSGDTYMIAGVIIAAVAPTLFSIATYYKAKTTALNIEALAKAAEELKRSSADTATSVEKAHVAINSERAALTDELKKVREEILMLSKQKATLEEHQRSQRAGESVVPAAIVAPSRMTDTQIFHMVSQLNTELEFRKSAKAGK